MTNQKHEPEGQELGMRLRNELHHNAKHSLDVPALPSSLKLAPRAPGPNGSLLDKE